MQDVVSNLFMRCCRSSVWLWEVVSLRWWLTSIILVSTKSDPLCYCPNIPPHSKAAIVNCPMYILILTKFKQLGSVTLKENAFPNISKAGKCVIFFYKCRIFIKFLFFFCSRYLYSSLSNSYGTLAIDSWPLAIVQYAALVLIRPIIKNA